MAHVTSIKEYFDTLQTRFVSSAANGVNAVFQFDISGEGGGTYHVIVSSGKMTVHQGPSATPSAVIKASASDYVKLVNGELNGMMAFMSGQIKVTGNVLLAQKMQSMFPQGT